MDTMFILGQYIFGLSTAAPAELQRDTTYNWAAQDVFGAAQSLQFTGWGEESITLQGVIYTEFIGDTGQLNAMRETADNAEPMTLIDGRGNILGDYVIKQVSERQDAFAQAGTPLKQAFTMSMARYGGTESYTGAGPLSQSMLANLRGVAPDGLAGLLNTLAGGVQAGGIAAAALDGAASVMQGVTAARDAFAYVQQGITAAKQLQSAAKSVQGAIAAINSADDLGSIIGALDSAVATAGSASNTAARSGAALIGMAGTLPDSVKSVTAAAGHASSKLAIAAAKVSDSIQGAARGVL